MKILKGARQKENGGQILFENRIFDEPKQKKT